MECTSIRELIYDYMKGVSPQEETDKVRGHLKHCSDCNEFYNEVEESLVKFGKIKELDPKAATWGKISSRLSPRIPFLLIFALCAVVGVTLAVLFTMPKTPQIEEDIVYLASGKGLKPKIEYSFNQDTIITIPNVGSITIVEDNTRLIFETKTLLKLNSGTIYGKLSASAVNSFDIKTLNSSLKIQGARFLVRILDNGETLVDSKDGQVEIQSKGSSRIVKGAVAKIKNNGEIEQVKDVKQSLLAKLDVQKKILVDRQITIKGSIENPSLFYPLYVTQGWIALNLTRDDKTFAIKLHLNSQQNVNNRVKIDASNPLKFSFELEPKQFEYSNVYTAQFVYTVADVKGDIMKISREIYSDKFEIEIKK